MRLAAIHTYPIKGCRRLDHDAARVEPWGLAGDRRWLIVDADGVGITQRQHPELVTLRAMPRPGGLRLAAPGRTPLDLAEPSGGEQIGVRVFQSRPPTPVRAAAPAADNWLSDLLGQPVRLVWLGDPAGNPIIQPVPAGAGTSVNFADGTPLLLASTASLDEFNGWLLETGSPEGPLPMNRFRPNLVISGAVPWAEGEWVDRRIRIGATVFRGLTQCGRCVVSATDQDTGVRGQEPLRTLGVRRNIGRRLLFGLQLAVELPSDPDPDSADRAVDCGTVTVGDSAEVLG